MAIKMRLILSQEAHPDMEKEIFCFDKGIDEDVLLGLSLDEAKQILKQIQRTVVEQQAAAYVQNHRDCRRDDGSKAITISNTAPCLGSSSCAVRDSTGATVTQRFLRHSAL